ncbi:MAG TPA: potassium transporter KefB [Ohtaekwangia sp.]|nr:potassium transporter KefB [Ohtaekwangia sp.]
MTEKNTLKTNSSKTAPLTKRMLTGALIGLVVIIFFVTGGDAKPEWGKFWMIRPLIVVPLAGAMGGAFYHFIIEQNFRHGWLKVLAIILSVIVFIVGLWLGIVLGLAGTHWD